MPMNHEASHQEFCPHGDVTQKGDEGEFPPAAHRVPSSCHRHTDQRPGFYKPTMPNGPNYFEERYGSSGDVISYSQHIKNGQDTFHVISKNIQPWTTVAEFFKAIFLPQGYPDSVSSDYLYYQIWDTFQAFVSSLTGTLATQAVLIGMGVGDSSATPVAATITWLLRDGTGMVGRIVFAWYKGGSLDCNSKQWRLFADVANDVALFLDLLAPHFSKCTMHIFCLSGIFKSLVGIAGSATRAAFVQHQAKRGNLADLAAKDGSQETIVNLTALVCSLALVPLITGSNILIWTLYVLFTICHLFGNYKAVRALNLPSLNRYRLSILMDKFLKDNIHEMGIVEVNQLEPLVPKLTSKWELVFGCSMTKLANGTEELKGILKIFRGSMYYLNFNRKSKILVSLHANSNTLTEIEAFFHAEIIRLCMHSKEFLNHISEVVTMPSALIVNTDESNNPGQHWVAFYFDINGSCEFFCSFGNQPYEYHEYWREFIKKWSTDVDYSYNSCIMQAYDSSACGARCCYVLYHRCHGASYEEIMNSYDAHHPDHNDIMAEDVEDHLDVDIVINRSEYIVNQLCTACNFNK